jgi:hypothetical protein
MKLRAAVAHKSLYLTSSRNAVWAGSTRMQKLRNVFLKSFIDVLEFEEYMVYFSLHLFAFMFVVQFQLFSKSGHDRNQMNHEIFRETQSCLYCSTVTLQGPHYPNYFLDLVTVFPTPRAVTR